MLSVILTASAVAASPAIGTTASRVDKSGAAASIVREYQADSGHIALTRDADPGRASQISATTDADAALPHCLELQTSNSPEDRVRALGALSQFNHADAFAALQTGLNMGLQGFDVPEQFTAEAVDRMRCAAARGLVRSPYPHARAYLRRFEDDPSPRIRMIVLEMVVARAPHSSADLTFLRRKTIDPDPEVAAAAKRLLREWQP